MGRNLRIRKVTTTQYSHQQQVLAAQQAAIKRAEQSAAAAKALAQQEVQQYSDKQALQGRLQEAPTFARAAKAKATHIANQEPPLPAVR
ncbi:hypothetical protein ACLB1E_16745 [Escherichia coli]